MALESSIANLTPEDYKKAPSKFWGNTPHNGKKNIWKLSYLKILYNWWDYPKCKKNFYNSTINRQKTQLKYQQRI